MYKLVYLPAALMGILEAETYLNEHSPRAAEKFSEAVEIQTDLQKQKPYKYIEYSEACEIYRTCCN